MLSLIRDPLNGPIIQAIVDDEGKLVPNLICPVACGKCCDGWVDVPELSNYDRMPGSRCPHLRAKGCKLKRSKRPRLCNDYLCELGFLACTDAVTPEEIKQVLNVCQQQSALSFLGRSLPVHELCELKDLRDATFLYDKSLDYYLHRGPR